MNPIPNMTESNLPEDALRFFHGLSNWVEQQKRSKSKLILWEDGIKDFKALSWTKAKKGQKICVNSPIPENTLFLPYRCSGFHAIKQLRHAFCHNGISYDKESTKFTITNTKLINLAGNFTLDAIKQFVKVFTQPAIQTNNSKKTK